MSKTGSIILRVLGAIVVLAIIGGAAAAIGYNLGVANSPAIAEHLNSAGDTDGYFSPMLRGGYPLAHGFGFFSLGHILGGLLLFCIVLGLIRWILFPRPWHMHGWHRWYGGPNWNGQMPPWAHDHGCGPQTPGEQPPAEPGEKKPESK
jgi:hypothetical protein